MTRNQRERLLAALTRSLYEVGYDKTTVDEVGSRAAVSKSDFYRLFTTKDECLKRAYDDALAGLRDEVERDCPRARNWPNRVLTGLSSLLARLAGDPARARLLFVEGLRNGRGILAGYQRGIEDFGSLLGKGAPRPAGAGDGRAIDVAVSGGVASLLRGRVAAFETERLPDFLPDIAEFALTPYLGAAEARIISRG